MKLLSSHMKITTPSRHLTGDTKGTSPLLTPTLFPCNASFFMGRDLKIKPFLFAFLQRYRVAALSAAVRLTQSAFLLLFTTE